MKSALTRIIHELTELLVVQAFSNVMTQMDAGVMTIEAMRRPVG